MSRKVKIGNITIGGGEPIAVQSMLNIPLSDTHNALAQMQTLEYKGCQIVRFAVPDIQTAESIGFYTKKTSMPLVADIHFDHTLAILAAKNGVSKVRINPGNIGSELKVKEVAACLSDLKIPIRIGVNSGSLEKDLLEKYSGPCAEAMTESAEKHILLLEKFGFDDIVVSLKSSTVAMTVAANRLFAARHDYPLHIGVTEAGSNISGIINSAVGIGSLLLDGIGDTVRVSLTNDPADEISAAKAILDAAGHPSDGIKVISCPTCARCRVNLFKIVEEVKAATADIRQRLTVAVMGCAVNGPGESREADLGIACGIQNGVLFKKGEIVRTVREEDITSALLDEIALMTGNADENN